MGSTLGIIYLKSLHVQPGSLDGTKERKDEIAFVWERQTTQGGQVLTGRGKKAVGGCFSRGK